MNNLHELSIWLIFYVCLPVVAFILTNCISVIYGFFAVTFLCCGIQFVKSPAKLLIKMFNLK
jgi:hypothetical protein